ncbi:MAG: hypothetical protein EOO61_17545 [Hymenobacter sp.]|nr:MAG: hypothetical protein EOO61_17545 [Hymenobacter sp.]
MKLFQKLLTLLKAKQEPAVAIPSDYSDEEFLSVVMDQARKRTQADQAAQAATIPTAKPVSPLAKAA